MVVRGPCGGFGEGAKVTERFLLDGPADAGVTILLAHGAGAPMDAPSLEAAAAALASVGFRIARFEFPYMAARRVPEGSRRPPPRAEALREAYLEAVAALPDQGRLVIGGKSLGGRVASLVADQLHAAGRIAGLLCLGYPFHPPAKPEQTRTAHLQGLKTPTLIAQGTRDPFGTPVEVAGYVLSPAIGIFWLEDGDHDLKPRRRVTGLTQADHLCTLAARARLWADGL